MRKIIMFWLVGGIFAMLLAGCGNTETVYMQAPVDQTGAKLRITGKNTQELQLFSNKDGSIRFLDNGSIAVFPQEVEKVVFSSYRMGTGNSSPIFGSLNKEGLIIFSGMPNNAEGEYQLIMKDSSIAPINILLERNVVTYKPMKFWVSDTGWFSYGDQVETTATMRIEGENMIFDFQFGCDMLTGIIPFATFSQGMTVEFVTTGGRSFPVEIRRDDVTGNLSASGMMIPLIVLSDSQWGQRAVTGNFYVVNLGGEKFKMNFSYSNEGMYQWYLRSSTDQFYMSYLLKSDEVQIQQYFNPTI
jgi:hypothetical protein